MPLACPKCGSRNLRFSRFLDFAERCQAWIGVHPLRCRDCRSRFVDRTWRLSSLRYARCPKCWRMDLNSWSRDSFRVPMRMLVLLALGARPYRCEYCRVNFVSFRRRFERFTFKRWKRRAEQQQQQTVE
jgi:hypothetical protein